MKTFQEKIGVKIGVKLGPTSCRARAKTIRLMVNKNEVKGEARRKLLKQAAWYAWKANQFKKTATKGSRKSA